MKIEDLKRIEDPYERAEQACAALRRAHNFTEEALDVRNFAFNDLHHKHGESIRAIATRYGVSKTLVAGIVG